MINLGTAPKQVIKVSNVSTQKISVSNTGEQAVTLGQLSKQQIHVDTSVEQEKLVVGQDGITVNVNAARDYEGDYLVTPKFVDQTLQTSQRILKEDVRIEKISVTRVSNSSGGNTVIIGG